MAIVILSKSFNIDPMTNAQVSRNAYFYISSGAEAYVYNAGSLSLTGSLQTILNGMEAQLFTDAQASGTLPTSTEIEIVGAIQWYLSAPGTKAAVFDKTVAQEVTDITALIAASFPTASAAVKAGWLQLLMSSLLDTRVNAHDRDLV